MGERKKGRMRRRVSAGWDVSDLKEGYLLQTVLTFGDGLDESREHEGQIVARLEAMPECACQESGQTRNKSRLFSLRGHTQVHVIP